MTQRIFVKVNRGMTDKTIVRVYPWEKQILEMVHGQDCEPVTIDAMCDMKEAVKIEKMKLMHGNQYAPGLRDQLIEMATVDPESDPANDPATEYNRMAEKYGMDKDMPMPVVTRLYGEFASGAFEKALKAFQRERPHGNLKKGERKMVADPEKMSVAELRDALTARGIKFDAQAAKPELIEQLTAVA